VEFDLIKGVVSQLRMAHNRGPSLEGCGSGCTEQSEILTYCPADIGRRLDQTGPRVEPLPRPRVFAVSIQSVFDFTLEQLPQLLLGRVVYPMPARIEFELVEAGARQNVDVCLFGQPEEERSIAAAPDRLGVDYRLPTNFLKPLHFLFCLVVVIEDEGRIELIRLSLLDEQVLVAVTRADVRCRNVSSNRRDHPACCYHRHSPPFSISSKFSVDRTAIRSTASVVRAPKCGVSRKFGRERRGSPSSGGSFEYTSWAATAICPLDRASYSAGS